ncbi:hypothetical protein PoB_001591500 [Plakobranchus ocellatus]|uniref:Uncharacterized protein n=1 Tax=Plakobranchus ocellatus TaxID=259542 RepID=A0AAV3Z457_9GAST|nr:hypothetical protein PoB_001591500 [Plakobranchus ocellatus]
MAQVQYLQVPGWERFPSGDDKHMMECSYKLSHCHISGNNNNNNISSTVSNNNTVNSNASAISTSSSNSTLTVNGRCSDVVVNANDKYTAAIELSNRCREFYNSRLAAASSIKSRWSVPQAACDNHAQENNNNTSSSVLPSLSSSTSSSPTSSSSSTSLSSTSNCSKVNTPDVGNTKRRTNSIDQAMDRLRTEMVSVTSDFPS